MGPSACVSACACAYDTLLGPGRQPEEDEMDALTQDTAEELSKGLEHISKAIDRLGTNNAINPDGGQMGAVEFLAVKVEEASSRIAEAINNLAEAIRDSGNAGSD